MLKKIINKFRNRESKIFKEDIFVTSYPKSGNTWTRFVLSHLLTKCEEQLTFINCDYVIPDYDVHKDIVENLKRRPRILKSHSEFNIKFPKVVYIIRDPRDVYVSYFHYINKRLPKEMTFKEFIRNNSVKSSWESHVKSWEKHPNRIIIRYEDMLERPTQEFKKIIDFTPEVGWDKGLLIRAVEMSTFDKMKKVEKEHGRNFLTKEAEKKSSTFMRKGVKGDWVNYFDEEDLNYLNDVAGDLMEKYGYK